LKNEVAGLSRTLLHIYQILPRYMPKYGDLQIVIGIKNKYLMTKGFLFQLIKSSTFSEY